MSTEDYTNTIEQRVRELFDSVKNKGENKEPSPPPIPVKQKDDNSVAFLLVVLGLLVIGFFIAVNKKDGSFFSNLPNVSRWTDSFGENQQVSNLDYLKSEYERLDEAAGKIWERTKWNSDHMILLATVNNHNLAVLQQNLPKSELIFINEDFTISRMPNRIKLDPADEKFIKKFVRSK